MPSAYAHFAFGHEVLKILDDEIKDIIRPNTDLYNIGLHGPDILFYYKPLKPNPINKKGHALHEESAEVFFKKAKSVIRESPAPSALQSYILGFICHFMLDSACHPYINAKEKGVITHSVIETEFDRLLMAADKLDPLSHKPAEHLKIKPEYAECICRFFEGISEREIIRSLKSMKTRLSLMVAPGIMKRTFIETALKATGNYKGMIGLMMRQDADPEGEKIAFMLKEIYDGAIFKTAEIVRDYYKNIYNDLPLDSRFNRRFD